MAKPTKVTAKVVGKVKAAGKALAGQTGIFSRLAEEHGEVAVMMKRVAGSSPDSTVRKELFPEIRANLLAHAEAEERTFYPVLRQHPDTKTLVVHSRREHEEVKRMLEELHGMQPSDPLWTRTFEKMMHAVLHHVDEEENEVFPRAQEALTKEQSKDIEKGFVAAKEAEMKRLSP